MEEEEKALTPNGIQTHDLLVTRCALYHFATTAAPYLKNIITNLMTVTSQLGKLR